MHREYAVDPQALDSYERITRLIDCFFGQPQRLISDCPKRWANEVRHAVNRLKDYGVGPVERKKLKLKVEKLSKANLCANRSLADWDRQSAWLSYALKAHEDQPFDGLLGANPDTEVQGKVYSLDDLAIDAPPCWDESKQSHLPRTAASIAEFAGPLIRVSRRLILVDPYFWFTAPNWYSYEPLLRALLGLHASANYGAGLKRLEIHTSDRFAGLDTLAVPTLTPTVPMGLSVACKIWPKDKMHDRFIMTDVGGISLGRGLGVFEMDEGGDVLAAILEHDAYAHEMKRINGQCLDSIEL